MNRKGFSLIEMLVVTVIIGILANIAFPLFGDIRLKAQAARIIADVHTIEIAALNQFSDTGVHPRNGRSGTPPAAFVPYLPDGFSFRTEDGTRYRWRRYSLPNGLPRRRNQNVLIGVQVNTSNRDLMDKIKNLYGGETTQATARKIVFVIE